MKKSLLVVICRFFAILFITSSLFASTTGQQPFFEYELVNVGTTEAANSRLWIFINVLNDNLSFQKADSGGFEAQIENIISIENLEGEIVDSFVEIEKIHASTFAETNSRTLCSFRTVEFDLPPGKYKANIAVTDLQSSIIAQVSCEKELRDFSDPTTLRTSDMILVDQVKQDPNGVGRMEIRPALQENTTAPGRELFSYLEVYCHAKREPLNVRYLIRDKRTGNSVLDQRREWPQRGNPVRLALPVWTDNLPYGSYEAEIQIRQGEEFKSAAQSFRVVWDGVPETAMHLAQSISVARSLAANPEEEKLLRAEFPSLAERKQALLDFWKSRDVRPETPECEAMETFYQRVYAANERFGGTQEGWKTDFGKVFVKFGPPDQVEMMADHAGSGSSQIWHYHGLNRRFLFIDRNGQGEYWLASSNGL